MPFGLKKQRLDFEILDTGNPKTLVFLDSSDYYKNPESPILQITLPGYNKYFVTNVVARKINTFNSNTIGLTDSYDIHDIKNLPDGVWTISYRICPYEELYVQKYHLRTVLLEQTLGQIYDKLELSDCDVERDVKLKQDIVDIILAIESGKANACKGNVKKASTLYQKAQDLVEKTLNKLTENCC